MKANTDSLEELRLKLLKICHKYEDKDFMVVHGKCDLDLAAPRCAKRVREFEALIKAKQLELLERVEKIIGDDDPENTFDEDYINGRNNVRAEQRKALDTLRGEIG